MPDLYYMTPIENAPLIAALGILPYNFIHSDESIATLVRTIADPFVNQRRHHITVDGRSLHDYVPLYWATHTPMQYVVTFQHNLPQHQLVFFVLDSDRVLALPGVLTTDGNAASSGTVFYSGDGALDYLDWRILRTPNCYSPEYKRKKCAEVLVPDRIPQELIRAIHTLTDAAASDVREMVSRLSVRNPNLVSMIERVSSNPALYY